MEREQSSVSVVKCLSISQLHPLTLGLPKWSKPTSHSNSENPEGLRD